MMKIILMAAIMVCTGVALYSQTSISIPAYTAYAVPAEESSEDDESNLFTEKDGLHHWVNTSQEIQFYFQLNSTGKLTLSLLMKNSTPGSKLIATIAGKSFSFTVPASAVFKKITIGTVMIQARGFYSLVLRSQKNNTGKNIADIRSLELTGEAITQMHFNPKPRRNAASVHLRYPLHDSMKVISFYNELTIPTGSDALHSYFMACGFARGYFGMQVNRPAERRIIFSVWDAGNEDSDRNKVNDENKVKLMAKGEEVFADGFGNEGTGGHSHWIYNWKPGMTYKFLVTAATDSASATTSYAGYFFIPETQRWKLIACFKAPKDGKPLRSLYSFSENFWGNNGQLFRKSFFGNQWVRRENGEWKEITTSTFSYDATGKAGDRIDYGGGTEDNKFYLWHGGFKQPSAKYGDTFTRAPLNIKPIIDFYKNADSLAEIRREKEAITTYQQSTAIAGDVSAWKEKDGVHFKILKEGSGDYVALNDTIVIHYKGQLLDGFIFDQTKEKPATFPLKRLIKGWQTALPQCRKGGKILILLPSHMAYSIRNLGMIPPNSVLQFEIEVVDIIKGN